MPRRKCLWLFGLIILSASHLFAAEWSLTVLPAASVKYRGEGKFLPQAYANAADGQTSPLYRLEVTQPPAPGGYWGLSLWHTGVFGGGNYAAERVPDMTTGGHYQVNRLNVGFTNMFATYHRPFEGWPVEALINVSVVREIFKRKSFVVQGRDYGTWDDVTEISAEGLGFGLEGRHGRGFYARWRTAANQYVQIFDAKTDSSAGQIFQAEGGLGAQLFSGLAVELGGLWQYWFTHGQGGRRIALPGSDGVLISWNRNETRASGAYLLVKYTR